MKTCTRCARDLAMDAFPRRRAKRDGRDAWCRACKCSYERERRLGDGDRIREAQRASYRQHRPVRLARQRRYSESHRTAEAARSRAWRADHPEHVRANNRRYSAEHAEDLREKKRLYMATHPAIRAQNLKRRKARKRGAGVATLTTVEWRAILARFEYRCAYCGAATRLTQDHVVALSRGGSHTADNVVPACRPCNRRKYNRDVGEFLAELRL